MDWNINIGVLIGEFTDQLMDLLQIYLSDKRREKEKIRELKLGVLEDLVGYPTVLVSNYNRNAELHRACFFSALNRIVVTFSDSEELVEKHHEFQNVNLSRQTNH